MNSIRQVVCLGIALTFSACGNSAIDEDSTGGRDAPVKPVAADPVAADSVAADSVAVDGVEIVEGLSKRVLREGTGAVAEVNQIVVVHYTGWLFDATADNNRGEKFDSSVDRGQHFEFPLGARRVIRGWDEGVVGMKIGEIRELTIAPELAYGERGAAGGLIPPGATLVFEVELANLKNADGTPLSAQ